MKWKDASNQTASIRIEFQPENEFSHPVIEKSNRDDFIGVEMFRGYLTKLTLSSGKAIVKKKQRPDDKAYTLMIGEEDSAINVIV